MNNNFTHKELKNFKTRFSNFYKFLPALPADPWFAVNFLLTQYNNLLKLPAISESAFLKFCNAAKPALQLKPIAINQCCSIKKADQYSL